MTNLYALRKLAAEAWLDDTDPEWRSRFFSDWQRAEDFYRSRRSRVIHHSTATEPAEYADRRDESDDDNDAPFDETDLDGSVRE